MLALLKKRALQRTTQGDAAVFVTHVRDSTGFSGRGGTIDAMSMGLWPSRGLHLQAYEIKCSRADWLRELKQPAKAEWVHQHVHRFWLVVSDKDFVHDGELPQGWGLLAPQGRRGLVQVVEAAFNEEPEPISMKFLASIMRSCVSSNVTQEELAELRRVEKKRAEEAAEYKMKTLKEDADKMREAIKKFEEASGVSIYQAFSYIAQEYPGDAGKAMKVLMEGETDVRKTLAKLQRLGGEVTELLEKYELEPDANARTF